MWCSHRGLLWPPGEVSWGKRDPRLWGERDPRVFTLVPLWGERDPRVFTLVPLTRCSYRLLLSSGSNLKCFTHYGGTSMKLRGVLTSPSGTSMFLYIDPFLGLESCVFYVCSCASPKSCGSNPLCFTYAHLDCTFPGARTLRVSRMFL